MPQAPRYALAVSGVPRSSSSARASRSSPSTYAIFGCRPRRSASSLDRLRESGRVEAAGVADDLDAAVERLAQTGLELLEEGPRVPEGRVLQPVPAEDQHGQLGQVVAGQHVERTAGEHLVDRAEPVAVEAGRVADPDRRGHPNCPGFAALPRQPGEGLDDPEPLLGVRAFRPYGEVVAVPALGRQQAEVERRSGHPLRGVLRAPGPGVAVRAGEFHVERVGRRGAVVQQVGEVARANGEVGDVPQPVARLAGGRRARRTRPARAPRSPSTGRSPSRSDSSAGRTRAPSRRPGPSSVHRRARCGSRASTAGAGRAAARRSRPRPRPRSRSGWRRPSAARP